MTYTSLVDTSTLTAHLDDPNWVIFDCRHDLLQTDAGFNDYSNSHIPGAFFASVDNDLAGVRNGRNGRHPLPDPNVLAEKLARAGLAPGKQLIAYDAQGGIFAARLWWLARWLGHGKVAVLDGGWRAWSAENRPCSAEFPSLQPGTLSAKVSADWVNVDYLQNNLRDLAVIDARAPDRFRGENETLDPVGGRIPGARNRFYQNNLAPDGRFKPAEVLASEFKVVLRDTPVNKVVHSCGSGVSACHNLLAMEIAAMPGSRLYPGSWSEWCADASRPLEKG
ncbi:MAG: sulfurtransferase [Burkholderiales bacterium]